MSDESRPSLVRRTIVSIVLVVVLLGVGFAGFQALKAQKEDSRKEPGQVLPDVVRVRTAVREDYTERLFGFGKARALRRTAVAAEVPGYVEWISDKIEPGMAIEFDPGTVSNGEAPTDVSGEANEAGPVVVRLEKRDYADQLERAGAELRAVDAEVAKLATAKENLEARLEIAKEEEESARREYKRIERLVETKRLAKGDLDEERLKLALRERSVLQLESSLLENTDQRTLLEARRLAREKDIDLAARNLGRTSVHVPAPGIIAERNVNAGAHVRVGSPLFAVLDLSVVEIPIALPARRWGDVHVGSEATVYDAQTHEVLWKGGVARISPEINESERTFSVFLEIPGSPTKNAVPPGRHVRAEIVGRTYENVVVLAREVFVGESIYVVKPDPEAPYVVNGDPEAPGGAEPLVIAERRLPEIERLLTSVALVRSGIEAGEEYVVSNLEAVADGSRLRVAAEVETPDEASADDR